MKLITETTENIEMIVEKTDESGKKDYWLKGVFMQAEEKNRNGRVYPIGVLGPKVSAYCESHVKKNRALGELNHPQGPTVNLDRASHIIKDLAVEGNDIVGRAKVLDTPMGKIVQNLIDGGAQLGVSSRGMGSLKTVNGINEVQDDYLLAAVDIVADPSAPNAFVNGIMEGKEWIWDNGLLIEKQMDFYHKEMKNASKQELEEKAIKLFEDFLSKI
tara:strand:+ start:616 stop:1263 length:648 start_codon:yes stop_codon:yes gene_type:complete